MKRIVLALLLLALSTSSCNKFLETEPTDFFRPDTFYNNEFQLETALNGVYDILTAYDEMYGQNYQADQTAGTDETYRNGTAASVGNYQHNVSYLNTENHWKTLYRGIELANLLLANIDKPATAPNRNIIKGQALFLRGYYYFMLVNSFGDVPLKVLPTVDAFDTQIPRTPKAEVYAQIIADMTEADILLTNANYTSKSLGFGGKVSKTVVEGIMARVYLYMAGFPLRDQTKYAKAVEYALKVVNSGEHALNTTFDTSNPKITSAYQQIFVNYAQDKYNVGESMWECEMWGNRGVAPFQEAGRIGNFSGPRCENTSIGVSFSTLRLHAKVYNLYESDPTSPAPFSKPSPDFRRDWNCCNYNYGTNASNMAPIPNNNIFAMDLGKFRREYETLLPKDRNFTSQNFPLLRYADVLLMLAEAENEVNGPTALAYNAINQVRRRAYAKPLNTPDTKVDVPVSLSKDAFRRWVQDERVRELCGEALRKSDLIRWGIFFDALTDNTNYITSFAPVADQAVSAQAGKNVRRNRDELLPIPLRDMNLNSSLVQNPGW